PATSDDLGEQPAEGVADDGRLLLQSTDDVFEVIRDITDGLVCEHLGMCLGLGDRVGVIRPAGRQRGVSVLLEELRPPIPAAGEQPQSVNEHDWRAPDRVRTIHLLRLVLGDRRVLLVLHAAPPAVVASDPLPGATLGGTSRSDKRGGTLLAGGWPSGRRRRS